ncbi:DUF882 domain-containing protein [Candidatus Woesearchaeota archaeon]|nr:DUF882 domain-containing protein [Candidatus Woesearchaeota archaeon]
MKGLWSILIKLSKKKDIKVSLNFRSNELACRCGNCPDEFHYSLDAINVLQRIRDKTGAPIHVTSAYRCPAHNKAIGGVKNSQHVKGKAFDIVSRVLTPSVLHKVGTKILDQQWGINKGGRGKYKTFVHLDVRPRRAEWKG